MQGGSLPCKKNCARIELVIKQACLVVSAELKRELEGKQQALIYLYHGQTIISGPNGQGVFIKDSYALMLKQIIKDPGPRTVLKAVEFSDYIPTGFIPILMQLGEYSGYFDSFKLLPFAEGEYTSRQKSLVLIAALATGCPHNVDINHRLKPYPALAKALKMLRIPDQCTINRYLKETGAAELTYLQLILESTLNSHGLWRQLKEPIDVDVDTTGLAVSGRTYEAADKGYLPGQRGQKGYQLNLGICSYTAEWLAVMLDPASVSPGSRFWDILYGIAEVIGGFERMGLVRADAIHGTKANMLMLLERRLSFLLKGKDARTARNLAKDIPFRKWETLDIMHEVAEAEPLTVSAKFAPIRTILVKTKKEKRTEYSHLYTTISPEQMEPVEVAVHYNKRQIIEAEIKAGKNGPCLDHLRTRSFYGNYGFMYHLAYTINLILLFRHLILKDTPLYNLGIKELITRMMNIPAQVRRKNGTLYLGFPREHELVRKFFKDKTEFVLLPDSV